jgi:hypothetical protein
MQIERAWAKKRSHVLDKLERKLGRLAIPHLTLFLVGGQAATWVLSKVKPEFAGKLVLIPAAVMRGEVWRLVSFLFTPPGADILLGDFGVILALLILFSIGRALEDQWGAFKYNVYVFVGWAAAIAVSFVDPYGAATNVFLMQSIFLAFAYLFPDYVFYLFFVLPVKVKWLALLVAIEFAWAAFVGDTLIRLLIAAGVLNFFLFFGRDIVMRLRGMGRRRAHQQTAKRESPKASMHTCSVCGLTDTDDPAMQFRYCSQCAGGRGYCADHIRDHEHVR